MNKKLLSVVAVAALAVSANASAVEASKYFVRANAGYAWGQKPVAKGSQNSQIFNSEGSSYLQGVAASGAVGYNVTDCVRADVSYQYNRYSSRKTEGSDDSNQNAGNFLRGNQNSVLVNVFYDFFTDHDITPFISGGIGWSNTKYKLNYQAPNTVIQAKTQAALTSALTKTTQDALNEEVKSNSNLQYVDENTLKSSNTFAFQVGAGLAYKISEDMFAEFQYKFSRIGKKTMKPEDFDSQVVASYTSTTKDPNATPPTMKFDENVKFSDQADFSEISSRFTHTILAGVRVQF